MTVLLFKQKNKLKANCTIPNKKFVLSVHYNATCQKIRHCISDNSVLHYSHTMNGNVYSFALDYELSTTDKIQKIHKYLMKKHNI